MDLSNRAATLSNWLRERSSALEKTEELLTEMNLKIKKATEESGEGNKVSAIQGAITVLKKELIEMDQKR